MENNSPDITIHDMTLVNLRDRLIGKTVINIDPLKNRLTLDDGAVFEFRDTHDCCAWFKAQLHTRNLTDNAITDVELTGREVDTFAVAEAYTIHVLAANKNIVDIDIEGDPTSGYYCHSITLAIYAPKE